MKTIRMITVSGEACSGKSSFTDELMALLPGWTMEKTGEKFKEYCASKGIDIKNVSHLDDDIHREFDALQKQTLSEKSKVILEGRLAGWLAKDMPDVFRIFCFAPEDVRIARCIKREGMSLSDATESLKYRDANDVVKYRNVYGLEDYRAPEFYNLQVDTSTLLPRELAANAFKEIEPYLG